MVCEEVDSQRLDRILAKILPHIETITREGKYNKYGPHPFRPEDRNAIKELADSKAEINDALTMVNPSPLFPHEAMRQYIKRHLKPDDRRRLNEILLSNIQQPRSPLAQALIRLNPIHKLIATYLSLAFRRDYISSHRMRDFLQNQLWTMAEVHRHIQNDDSVDGENFILLIFAPHMTKAIAQFEQYVLSLITSAHLERKQGISQCDYPLVEMTLDRLEQCKGLFFTNELTDLEIKADDLARLRLEASQIAPNIQNSTGQVSVLLSTKPRTRCCHTPAMKMPHNNLGLSGALLFVGIAILVKTENIPVSLLAILLAAVGIYIGINKARDDAGKVATHVGDLTHSSVKSVQKLFDRTGAAQITAAEGLADSLRNIGAAAKLGANGFSAATALAGEGVRRAGAGLGAGSAAAGQGFGQGVRDGKILQGKIDAKADICRIM